MRTYTIRRGDTLWALARRFNTSIDKLVEANGIKNPDLIITGHKLRIPDGYDTKPRGSTPTSPSRPTRPGKRPRPSPSEPAPTTPGKTKPPKKTPEAAALDRVPRAVAAKYEFYKKQILAGGGQFRTGPGRINLLGIRTPTNTHAAGGQGRYDDKLVAVWVDRSGKPHVSEYKYNNEPAYAMRAYSSDMNRDGVADQGRIPKGFYDYAKSSWKHGFCLRATRDFGVERDWNHDGNFTEKNRTGGGASMLFHEGGSYGTYSAGCQTFPPSEWARFIRDMRGAAGTIGYTLVQRRGQGAS
jgi:murein DD-endopeptidase MepM/ murein hydrolase activator NlpD